MAKEKKQKYTPGIQKRFLSIIDETIKEGKCDSIYEFLESIGEHRSNSTAYKNGTRSPTLEQLATACMKYGYSPTWCILGVGNKKLNVKDEKTIEDRVSELEATVSSLKLTINRRFI
jgi:hypothetical protein